MREPTISLAAAAERLNTNTKVIQRWIDDGHISATIGQKGEPHIDALAFDQLCSELIAWLQKKFPKDVDGYGWVTVTDIEQFWRERQKN